MNAMESVDLLNILKAHISDVVDDAQLVIDDGIISNGTWEFNAITIIYGRRLDEPQEGEPKNNAFQKASITEKNIASVLGMLEISKAEIIHNISND